MNLRPVSVEERAAFDKEVAEENARDDPDEDEF